MVNVKFNGILRYDSLQFGILQILELQKKELLCCCICAVTRATLKMKETSSFEILEHVHKITLHCISVGCILSESLRRNMLHIFVIGVYNISLEQRKYFFFYFRSNSFHL